MTDPLHTHQHPFFLESTYRETAAATTNGDLRNHDRALQPLIDLYLNQRDTIFSKARERADPRMLNLMKTEKEKPWWWLMPITLPPYRSNHEFALT